MAGEDIITTTKAIDLQYGFEPSDHGGRNNTVDFGFYMPDKPVTPPVESPQPENPTVSPVKPPQSTKPPLSIDLANTGMNLWAIVAGVVTLVVISVMVLLGMRKKQRR